MKQIQIADFGTSDVLRCIECEPLLASPHQVVVKVSCAALNPIDYKTRKGLGFVADKVRTKLPWTPGYDIAGTINGIGSEVSGWRLGQRVCGMVNFPLPAGGYSEQVAVNPELLVSIPDTVTDAVAAAAPLAGLTAWQGLFEAGHLCSGQNVLVLAAAGGVGHIAAQLAKHAGAHVWGTASANNREFIESLGVRHLDYQAPQAMATLPEMDLVFDGVGGDTGKEALACLREGGMLVTLPTITADTISSAAREQGKSAKGYTVHPEPRQLQNLLQHIASGHFRVEISRTFPIKDVAEAHKLLETGHVRGKILLTFEDAGIHA